MGRKPKGSTTECITSFFKVLNDDFHNKLSLPVAFIKNFNGNVPKKVILDTNPTTRSWTVSVEKDGDNFFLCDEWRTFAEDHALESREFLVFRYNGSSKFTVTVFGKNNCKKGVDTVSENEFESNQVENNEETRGFAEGLFGVLHESPDKSTNDQAIADKMRSRRSKGQEATHSFNATLGPHNKYRLTIPSLLVIAEGLTEKEGVVLLDECGRSWPVKVIFTRQGGLHLGAGWFDFCVANRLSTHDTCRFEFIRGTQNAIRVTVFRKSARGDTANKFNAGKPVPTSTSKEAAKIHEFRSRKRVSSSNYVVWAKEKEKIIASSGFTCDNPFCSIMLRSTNVNVNVQRCYVVLPRIFARKYLKGTSQDFTLRVSYGDAWYVRYSVGEHHMFTSGWRAFVLENHLEEYDVCIFELVDPKFNELKVHVIRP